MPQAQTSYSALAAIHESSISAKTARDRKAATCAGSTRQRRTGSENFSTEKADTTIPQGVPCTRLANLILAPKQERQRIAAYVPRWGIQLAAHLSESTAWAIYRDRLKRFGSLIGDREPIVLHKDIPGMGRAKRYIITIADDDRAPLDRMCRKLIAADATCNVLRNPVRKHQ
jgi:hypothetical protein